jgi:hypothetical protein
MTDGAGLSEVAEDVPALQARAEALEQQLAELRTQAAARLVQMELKAEALRAGMVDLDGLKLIDTAGLSPDSHGEFSGASEIIAKLRRDKPWLFGAASSSSSAVAPQPASARRKLATEMSLEEWRTARAELLRRT